MGENILMVTISKEELSQLIGLAVRSELSRAQEKDLLNAKELCEFLGISPSTLNKWKREDKIPYLKNGKRVFFSKTEVLSALKKSNYHKLRGEENDEN